MMPDVKNAISNAFKCNVYQVDSVITVPRKIQYDVFQNKIWKTFRTLIKYGTLKLSIPKLRHCVVYISIDNGSDLISFAVRSFDADVPRSVELPVFDTSMPIEPSSAEGVAAELRTIVPSDWSTRRDGQRFRVITSEPAGFTRKALSMARFLSYGELTIISQKKIDSNTIFSLESFGVAKLHFVVSIQLLSEANRLIENKQYILNKWDRLYDAANSTITRELSVTRGVLWLSALVDELGLSSSPHAARITAIANSDDRPGANYDNYHDEVYTLCAELLKLSPTSDIASS